MAREHKAPQTFADLSAEELRATLVDLQKELAAERQQRTALVRAVLEAKTHRANTIVREAGRDYGKELHDLLVQKLQGIANPKFSVQDGYIYCRFDEIGPIFKVEQREVLRRRGPRPDLKGKPKPPGKKKRDA